MLNLPSACSSICQRTKQASGSLLSFCCEVVQWRRPVLSSFYLLVTNTAFWACVFYLETYQQLLALIATAVLIFVSCVLSTAVITVAGLVTNAQDSYRKWFSQGEDDSILQRGSIVSAIVKRAAVVAFVLESLFLPMFTLTFSLFLQRPASIMVMTGSLCAAHYVQIEQQEKACWTAYLTVLLAVLVPPWRYNDVTKQITTVLTMIYEETWKWTRLRVINPISRFLLAVYSILRYCICGYWIPPLVATIVDICERTWRCVCYYFLDPVRRTLSYLKRQFIYWACGYWIPPLIEYLQEKKRLVAAWIYHRIVEPIVATYNSIKRFCIYWFGGYWIPPFCQYCVEKRNELQMAFRRRVIEPIIAFFSDFKNNMKYLLLGYWIPPFLAWFRRRVIDVVVRGIVKCYNTAEYILCGRWIPGFIAYLKKKAMEGRLYAEECLRRFRAYLAERFIRTKRYCRYLAIQTINYVKTNWIVPFLRWLKVTRVRLRHWFVNNVLTPAWEGTKAQWRRFKFYVKHHVLYPALRRIAYYILSGVLYVWKNAFLPVIAVVSAYGARGKEYAWANWVEPAVEWLLRHLPEKSPLVDDSDTELKDFLPSEEEENEEMDNDSSEGDGDELGPDDVHSPSSASNVEPSIQSGLVRLKRQMAKFVSPDIGSSSEEEDEFSAGLNFPAVENADSDEEEEKSMVPRKLSSSSVAQQRPRRTRGQSSGSSSVRSATPTKVPLNPARSSQSNVKTSQGTNSQNVTSRRNVQKLESAARTNPSIELEPDFEMIDHNDVDD